MAGEYPFPLPEASEAELKHWLGEHWWIDLDLPPLLGEQTEPYHLDCLTGILVALAAYPGGFRAIFREIAETLDSKTLLPFRDLVDTFQACIRGLEADVKRLADLQTMAKHTWKHDPLIRQHFHGNGDKGAAEKETGA